MVTIVLGMVQFKPVFRMFSPSSGAVPSWRLQVTIKDSSTVVTVASLVSIRSPRSRETKVSPRAVLVP